MRHRLFCTLLLAVFTAWFHKTTGDEICALFPGSGWRDCVCGIEYRDQEKRCCDEHTCFQPEQMIDNRTCPLACENGKAFDSASGRCTQCKNGYSGTCCERETPFCGGLLFEPQGEIKSPLFPRNYPNNFRCVWKISTDPAKRIALGLKDNVFDVEPGSTVFSCNHDWISIYDGENKDGRRIGSYCGNGMRTFQTVYSSGRHLYIEFRSDWQQRRQGFHLQYVTFFPSEMCGKSTFLRPTGIITSPQYPLNYRPNEQCVYHIHVRRNHYLVITTLEMNMPATADCSNGDHLLISKRKGKKYQNLTVLCGSKLLLPYIVSNARSVKLKFASDFKHAGRFKLRYEQIPL